MKTKIIYGDALELIKKVEDKKIDLIFCDFPFKFKLEKIKELAEEFYRVLKDDGSLILINNPTNFFRIIPYFQKFIFRNEIILIKPYVFVPFGKRIFYFKHNCILWLVKSKKYYFKDLKLTDVFDHIYYMVRGKKVGSLPEKLVETLLEALTKKGDFVLDVFAGYGTVLRVCKKMGRKYLGFEIVKGRVQSPNCYRP
ncbi:MAG: DNA-methyltransferase [Candidatus Njordarchaeales archaeon]